MAIDMGILQALAANVLSWVFSTFLPAFMPKLLPAIEAEDTSTRASAESETNQTKCIAIGRPGGSEQLRLIALQPGIATCGYNIKGFKCPFTKPLKDDTPPDCVVLQNEAFSVNYADCCIRWGLYESANQFVGWPIVPGFDVAGTVEKVGSSSSFQVGDKVFGCTLFGAYSTRVLVPSLQLKKIPEGLSIPQAASLPAVSLTALYALFLAGHYGSHYKLTNRAILIHSASGGVGSMLVQMSKILGLNPIVGVVGRTQKVEEAKRLGCHVVIDKSQEDLWLKAEEASPQGYSAVMDANGVSTLEESYNHLAASGRLIVYGFHSNLPIGRAALSPMEWISMAQKASSMPKFDPMDLTKSNKSILSFNLSFFADETDVLSQFFDQICEWIQQGKLAPPRVVEYPMDQIVEAHELIQSGKSIGKIVLTTPAEPDTI
ncbi:furan-3-one reductase [Seminavis robusta]|uniref:Furan-3-one reductase n=1 Tax=Seminavis robusta TaxID=568900 RepID=A0A9N8DIQ3_9STRA|nr:furan-3-one reductase [Seminavis robusta]|eukprot:Sro142_g066270.1 furan-3-one reductase (432) ;mRNA; f:63662-64957